MCYEFGGVIFGGAYTWRGLFSEFYGVWLNPRAGKMKPHGNARYTAKESSNKTELVVMMGGLDFR